MESQDRALLEEARRYGFIQDQEVWVSAVPALGHPARKVGIVRSSDDDSLLYFARRFQTQYRAKIDDLLHRYDEAENKGSYLMKVLHMKQISGTFDAIGDYATEWNRLDEVEQEIRTGVRSNRTRNLNIRTSLIEQAEELQESHFWTETSARMKELREAWIKTGTTDKELSDALEERFQASLAHFHTRKKAFYRERHRLTQVAKKRYKDLINESNRLKESSDWEATTRRLKQIQQDWKDVGGGLPRKQANELWTRLRAAHNYYFDRLQRHIAEMRTLNPTPGPDEILERKRDLVRQATALLDAPAHEAIPRTKELQARWKTTGTVRGPESDRVWEQFVVACDKVFEQSALEHYVKKKFPDLAAAPNEEQGRTRLTALREFLANDETEIGELEASLAALDAATGGDDPSRGLLAGKLRALHRKIRSKHELAELVCERFGLAATEAQL